LQFLEAPLTGYLPTLSQTLQDIYLQEFDF
jgi:hypothetical protein